MKLQKQFWKKISQSTPETPQKHSHCISHSSTQLSNGLQKNRKKSYLRKRRRITQINSSAHSQTRIIFKQKQIILRGKGLSDFQNSPQSYIIYMYNTIEKQLIRLKNKQSNEKYQRSSYSSQNYQSQHRSKNQQSPHRHYYSPYLPQEKLRYPITADPTKKWINSTSSTHHYQSSHAHHYPKTEKDEQEGILESAYFTECSQAGYNSEGRDMINSRSSQHVSPLDLNYQLQYQALQKERSAPLQNNYSFSGNFRNQVSETPNNTTPSTNSTNRNSFQPIIHCKIKIPKQNPTESAPAKQKNLLEHITSRSDLWIYSLIAIGILLIFVQIFK